MTDRRRGPPRTLQAHRRAPPAPSANRRRRRGGAPPPPSPLGLHLCRSGRQSEEEKERRRALARARAPLRRSSRACHGAPPAPSTSQSRRRGGALPALLPLGLCRCHSGRRLKKEERWRRSWATPPPLGPCLRRSARLRRQETLGAATRFLSARQNC